MVEVGFDTIMHVVTVIALGAFAWCWRLERSQTAMKTTQDIKTDDMATMGGKIDALDTKLSNVDNHVAELTGYLKGRFSESSTKSGPPA